MEVRLNHAIIDGEDWINVQTNKRCVISKEPSIYSNKLHSLLIGHYIEVNPSIVDESGKYIKARLLKSSEGWINKNHLKKSSLE